MEELGNSLSGIVSGIGSGRMHAWSTSVYGDIFSACSIYSGTNVVLNLKSIEDIKSKMDDLERLCASGGCYKFELDELKEIIRLQGSLAAGGNSDQTHVGIGEAVKTVYKDGIPYKIEKRKKVLATEAQKRAADNARKFAHSPLAEEKRRKSISARRDGKILGEV